MSQSPLLYVLDTSALLTLIEGVFTLQGDEVLTKIDFRSGQAKDFLLYAFPFPTRKAELVVNGRWLLLYNRENSSSVNTRSHSLSSGNRSTAGPPLL